MPTRAEYDKTLNQLQTLLRKTPMTAKQIAECFGVCKPVAYARVEELRKRSSELGFQVVKIKGVRESTPGPTSVAFWIRDTTAE
jgi:hypothetical protein